MPQIGWLEILSIVVIAILVLGPKEFPIALKKIGSYILSTKNPRVRPYFKNKKIYKHENCVFKARKHPKPPGTGTEPGSSSRLGPAPAPGTHQFSQVLLVVGPPVRTDPRENHQKQPFDALPQNFAKN